jgi:hypothetical protein
MPTSNRVAIRGEEVRGESNEKREGAGGSGKKSRIKRR